MLKLNILLVRGFQYSTLFIGAGYALLALSLYSCSADPLIQQGSLQPEESTPDMHYSIVFVIHGDGDYLYFDTSGNEHQADEKYLAEAKKVAQENPLAEVFIFHQRPRKNFLFLFPLEDGEFYYYRKGQLIANELYWRDQEHSYFYTEAELYRQFRTSDQRKKMSVFLYCGHEIPEFGGAGYDESYPDRMFTIQDFANGLKDFTKDSTRIDLLILSTCYGGTPYTIDVLGSFAPTIIASPDNLHLSYFDLNLLKRLDLSLQDGEVSAFAKRFAQESFARLTRDVQTSVSVAVYDVERVKEFLHLVRGTYLDQLITLKKERKDFQVDIGHCDCADIRAYVLPTMSKGVDIFFRPARFGRSKYKKIHSGWECWKE